MRVTAFIVGTLLWGWMSLAGQSATISGIDTDYRGVSIEAYIPGHPFLNKPLFSETVVVDNQGAFKVNVDLKSETQILFRTGIYDASLYIEPGGDYLVKLPAYREMTYTNRLSPFFEPVRIPLKVLENPHDLNHELYRFDSMSFRLNEQLLQSRQMGSTLPADSLIQILSASFENGSSNWFDAYRGYKAGILKLNEGITGLEEISKGFLGPVVRENHPAFMDLFGAMFKDFLVYYSRTDQGKGIRHHINRTHQLDSIRHIVVRHPAVWNDTLADLILLQELSSLFYRGDYHKEAILVLLDSMETHPVNREFAAYAHLMREKLSSLVIGYPPPDFSLTEADGKSFSPTDITGKYTYLMFCTPNQYGCMVEYPFLNSYLSKHQAYLEIVTVMVAEEENQVAAFMQRNDYLWKALYFEGKTGILDNYQIRAFPMAYLIGPDGKLVLSPAPLPSEGFEQELFRIMRSKGEI